MEEPHVLRYLAHLVLVLRTLGIEDMFSAESNEVIEAYIHYLVASNRLHLVAWYAAHLSDQQRQVRFPYCSCYTHSDVHMFVAA
jgi:hypothetical protein